jgi:hypothetical protein
MGDRVNVEVLGYGESVFLYGHWAGSASPGMVRQALKRGEERWGDPSYLARIIFCEMVRGSEMELTGFGISSSAMGGARHILVDVDKQTVTIDEYDAISFKDFIETTGTYPEYPEDEDEEAA